MDKKDVVISIIKEWDNSDLVDAWNKFCEDSNNNDERIYSMFEFNEFFNHLTPLEVIDLVDKHLFGTNDDYFAYDNYGRIVSFDDIDDYYCFDFSQLADYLIENGDDDITEVSKEELMTEFYDLEHIGFRVSCSLNDDIVMNSLEKYIEENNYNLLTDEWDEIAVNFIEYYYSDNND